MNTNQGSIDPRALAVFLMEWRRFFSQGRALYIVPFALLGILLVVRYDINSPFIPIFISLFGVVEAQYNNILFRSRNELEALSQFSMNWRSVVFVKNVATITLSLFLACIVSVVLLYFSPRLPSVGEVGRAALYFLTVVFPLLHLGNLRSVHDPRREPGWNFGDIAESLWMPAFAAIFSIPFVVFSIAFNLDVISAIYAVVVFVFWLRKSVPTTAQSIELELGAICERASLKSPTW